MAADVATTLAAWVSTSANNSPSGTTSVSTNLDDNVRELQGVVVRGLSHKGADIASAATTDIGAVEGLMHDITGTTTITALGTVRAGIWKILKFEGALTLTNNATSLILPGGENITTADGDIAILISEGSGNWRCVSYVPAAINPAKVVSTDETQTLTNKTLTSPVVNTQVTGTVLATQAQMEAGTDNVIVTPTRFHFHPGSAKAWCKGNFAASAAVSYNVASLTDTGTGEVTVNFTTGFATADYAISVATQAAGTAFGCRVTSAGTTSCQLGFYDMAGVSADATSFHMVAFGDFA